MIAELFYPKELKEIIADLRAKDDFNEVALVRLNKYIMSTLKKFVMVNLFFSLFLLHPKAGIDVALLIVFCLFMMLISILYELIRCTRKFSKLYNYGGFVRGSVEAFETHRGAYGMSCLFSLNGVERRSHMYSVRIGLRRKKYIRNDSVLVAYDLENPNHNIPFIESLADMFYLRKGNPYDNN